MAIARKFIMLGNQVANVVLVDDGAPYDPGEGRSLVDGPEHVQIGWTLAGDVWSPPSLPPATADDVRAECKRRLIAALGARDATHLDQLIANGSREAIRLLRIKSGRDWTIAEAARAAELEAMDATIESLRAASNAMEAAPPADYAADTHWPA